MLYQPVRDDAGDVTGIFVGGYDITRRVSVERYQAALLMLDQKLRDVDDPAALSYTASELLGATLDVARVGYGAIDLAAKSIVVQRAWSAPDFADVSGTYDFRRYGSYFDDLTRGLTVANADVLSDPLTSDNIDALAALGIAAFLDVPVMESGRLTSQMFVHSGVARQWTEDEISFARDVAERTRAAIARREAEEELRASEARLRALNADLELRVAERAMGRAQIWTVNPDMMGVINGDGIFEPSNPAWQTILGRSEVEVNARPFFDFVHPHDVERIEKVWIDAIEHGMPALRFENRYRTKDDQWRWLSWVAVPEDGKIYCSARDVTQDK